MDTSGSSTINGRHQPSTINTPVLVLEPVNATFVLKSLELPDQIKVKIGRQTGVTTAPHPSNGYFDSKVLSRVHAEVWSEGGKVYIRDLKSSNGTFLNGKRLCHENTESEPFELNQNDSLEFGIDIMDENGALLHEKVSCKIYISRMSYPTPGSSPQDSHAKLKPISPSASGVNSIKTNPAPAHGGQSDNIDLIISRLQSELTRSQETYADLGYLKHGLGPLKAENESLCQSLSQSNAGLAEANSKMSMVMASLEEMTIRHKDELEEQRRGQEAALAELEATHKHRIDQLVQDADQEQEALMAKHKEGLAAVIAQHSTLQQQQDSRDLEAEVLQLREEVQQLQQSDEKKSTLIDELTKMNSDLDRLMEETKAELEKALQQVSELQQRNNRIDLESLTPTLPSSGKNVSMEELGDRREASSSSSTASTLSNASTSTSDSPDKAATLHTSDELCDSNHEFSWAQFVFPIAKKNQHHMNQPSTMLLSGGFMLVGLGVYALWHKAGMSIN
ncbi:hypothetical protein BGX23_003315 [Mortierella sp. AD031]|nr:hypothetical protein BGX23_003315 [Mortierella sp. AD031]